MAKRKRLTPPQMTSQTPVLETAPEVKSAIPRYPLGVAPGGGRAPIADVAQDASATAALAELAQTLSDARGEGRLIQHLPLDAIEAEYLVRDRMETDADEMETLKESLRARGQQTAIEVLTLEDGRYGLISGWRRVTALRALAVDDPSIDTVLAIVRAPTEAAETYLAMVEENEIRVGLSYFERARIVARAVDAGVFNRDRVGLAKLFHAASRPKRSKIGSFVKVVRALGEDLRFPRQLTERNGLALAQALEAEAGVAERVREALQANPPADAAAEAKAIAAVVQTPERAGQGDRPAAAAPKASTAQAVDRTDPNWKALRMRETAKGEIILSGPLLQERGFQTALRSFLSKQDSR